MTPTTARFKNQDLLTQAFTHRSYCNEHPGTQSNERLEFLGDAVLSQIISERLYHLFPDFPEGELTAHRSLLVQTTTLAQKATALGLDQHLLLSRGEEDAGGRTNPSLLADVFEAVLGALFVDSGLDACRSYLEDIYPNTEITASRQTKDPKSLLQERAQAQELGTPVYKTVESFGPDHAKTFTVAVFISNKPVSQGTGRSIQKAQSAAAAAALSKLFPD